MARKYSSQLGRKITPGTVIPHVASLLQKKRKMTKEHKDPWISPDNSNTIKKGE